jgi:hypothetical protein
MDGNNSAKRMATAGHADHRKFTSRYMITSEDVEVFKDDVRLRPGERSADSDANTPLACTDNWKAANSTTENTVNIFEQTGIFLSACRHGMVQTIAEMQYSGELYVTHAIMTYHVLMYVKQREVSPCYHQQINRYFWTQSGHRQ